LCAPRTSSVGTYCAIAKPTAIPNLFVLPSGLEPDDPASSLFSPNLVALIARLEKEFDVVLVDSPPMLYLSDARALARTADGVILVLRLGKTNYDEALRAQQIFRADGTEIYGVVLNDFDPATELNHSYYSSYHRYQQES
jgi:Mrp family chromosome partitioning ATPase